MLHDIVRYNVLWYVVISYILIMSHMHPYLTCLKVSVLLDTSGYRPCGLDHDWPWNLVVPYGSHQDCDLHLELSIVMGGTPSHHPFYHFKWWYHRILPNKNHPLLGTPSFKEPPGVMFPSMFLHFFHHLVLTFAGQFHYQVEPQTTVAWND